MLTDVTSNCVPLVTMGLLYDFWWLLFIVKTFLAVSDYVVFSRRAIFEVNVVIWLSILPLSTIISLKITWNLLHVKNFDLELGPMEFYLKMDVEAKEMFVRLYFKCQRWRSFVLCIPSTKPWLRNSSIFLRQIFSSQAGNLCLAHRRHYYNLLKYVGFYYRCCEFISPSGINVRQELYLI